MLPPPDLHPEERHREETAQTGVCGGWGMGGGQQGHSSAIRRGGCEAFHLTLSGHKSLSLIPSFYPWGKSPLSLASPWRSPGPHGNRC